MTKITILGANGQIARLARQQFKNETNTTLTLFLRDAKRANPLDASRERAIDGDVTDTQKLTEAMTDADVVYANLGGRNIVDQAKAVVAAMSQPNMPKRLIWISTLGIYDEVPGKFGEWNHEMLDDGYLPTYAEAAKVIENSGLDYTIIRPAWLSNEPQIDYELTHKGDPFKGTEVSRASIAALVVAIARNPEKYIHESLGVNQPNTDGDKPSFY